MHDLSKIRCCWPQECRVLRRPTIYFPVILSTAEIATPRPLPGETFPVPPHSGYSGEDPPPLQFSWRRSRTSERYEAAMQEALHLFQAAHLALIFKARAEAKSQD